MKPTFRALPLSALTTLTALSAFAVDPAPELILKDTQRVESTADGALRPVVGVHNIQVVRANRTTAAHDNPDFNHTYLHAPMLAYWRGQFYLDYLSGPVNEHDQPTVTNYVTSPDGLNWSTPKLLFPAIKLADGTESIMHQRASFYVASGDRLLATGFHGKHPSPNDGTGVGRVIREIKSDGALGPIYFIRLNRHAGSTEANVPYPLYTKSPDASFVAACDALLADRRYTSQWWEEDRSEDGYYNLTLKAVSTVRRPDGTLLAVAKDAQHASSTDEGKTWKRLGFAENLPVNSSKYWLQKTDDGRYAFVFNPTSRLRFPLAIATSADAKNFGDLLTVHGDLPPQRFPGKFKNLGAQYVRGIVEGNGTPPDGGLWLTYSTHKEDIWVSRVPVPVTGTVPEKPIRDDFNATSAGTLPASWNIYSPAWAPVRVIDTKDAAQKNALELRDEDPFEYARAVRVFPSTHGVKIEFKVFARQTTGRLEIDVLGPRGERQTSFAFGTDGHLWLNHEGIWTDNGTYESNHWITFSYELPKNPKSDRGIWLINGKPSNPPAGGPIELTSTVERLSFRTGPLADRPEGSGKDLPGADQKVPAASFLVDDVSITPVR
ncbi:MAG: exo-alpha-sialidase [Nibricoccus sp.]